MITSRRNSPRKILDDAKQLVFASADQFALLKNARTCYLDATFRVVRVSFEQLLESMHLLRGAKEM